MGNVGPKAGKSGKAKDDQYKMKLGKGLKPKESYKTQVKPFRPAEDSTDEPETNDQMDTTTQQTPKQVSLEVTGDSHRAMHKAMDKLEEKPAANKKNQRNNSSQPRNSKKLSMF